jgi:hypothetical protein
MEFYDLTNLKQDAMQSNLYNMFDATFKYLTGVILYQYVVQQYQEMRIDTICQDIYNSTQYCDFLLDLNNIDLPLNIKTNDILLYVSVEQIDFFRLDETTAKTLRNTYLNTAKVSQIDPNRNNFINNNNSLPPTFLQVPVNSVIIKNNKIILGGNT